ncbi:MULTISPECIES: ATP-binding protein [unclassified Paenibacillus]|uniref:sensor histidine kinase n=1 Tax=unclassified Paenibacillus TaxID=185978 RepID=UPI000CFD0017|nr:MULTISPECIES: ATP-binding protein [unclassified Paenibacillus]PRA03699.1 two-component sensor histidine kinase [Paenibacillus sp. MYb63]PRA47118.1 two-component sensor histidine kinase [Paenibacillus sp. MYb67]QZN76862.1 HAMP domain-containing histidine kinase [Paenibacillus sp. DR312]
MSLRSKIYGYSSVLFAVLLIAVNLSVYIVFERMSIDNEVNRVEAEAESIVKGVRQSAGSIPPDDLLRAYAPVNGMLRIVNEDGTSSPVTTTSASEQLSKLPYKYESEKKSEYTQVEQIGYVWVSVPVIWPDGEVVNVQVTESIAETENRLSVLRTVLVAVTIIALIPAIISSRILANRMTRPIQQMTRTMTDIQSSGQFKRLPLEEGSKDELKTMGQTFNRMMDLLESNFERQERFVSDASHELKTPLTIIESYASLLQRRGKERPEVFDEAVEAILSESVRMREMTEQLLLLAKQPEQWNVQLERVDITRLATESTRAFREAYHREVRCVDPGPIWAISDESKLKQLLFILLDNARKYSEDAIEVRLEAEGQECRIRIVDTGIGIREDELKKVFDRFYRVDPARTRSLGASGSGLGLSLAKELAGAVGARIELTSTEGEGTEASIILPISVQNGPLS